MFSRFFIDRPIFAAVISIMITLAGAVSLFTLPLAQYPPVTPPTVQVDCNYPGASAQVVAESVGAPIEQQINGVEDMLYMSSQSTNDGSYSLTVTFQPGVDLNLANVLVQNRLSLAMPSLPEVVRQTGVRTRKRSPDILMSMSLNSPGGSLDQLYLSNYATLHLVEELARVPGVGEVRVFGQRDYSMRIWLDPDKLAVRNLTVGDVVAAIRQQNVSVAVGQIGQPPVVTGQVMQVPLSVKGRLTEPEEFADIVIRTGREGRRIRIKDVGRVEMSATSYDTANRFDGKATVGLAIFQHPDANALTTSDRVLAKMDELAADFPADMVYELSLDTTPFIRESVGEVFNSLRDAVILVALVVLVFLQGWRPAIIPLLAVPVAIIGTFAAMALAGFSLNNLTLFGLVLAIGIVVDDAIVVVEAVEQYIEQGFKPREAALRAMEQVAGPVLAVGLVLSAVFIPCAFISGIVGQFFRQFALTIAVSTILSTINSLTLSPALAALLLRSPHARKDWFSWLVDRTLGWLFRLFNRGVQRATGAYAWSVGKLLRVPAIVLAVYALLVVATYFGFTSLPTGFIPQQDKGFLMGTVQLPDSASDERMQVVMRRIEGILLETEGVKHVQSITGTSMSLGARGPNFGSLWIILDSYEKRAENGRSATAVMAELKRKLTAQVPDALTNVSMPAAVSGVGRTGGFRIMIEDRGSIGLVELQKQTDALIKLANDPKQVPELAGLTTIYKTDSPQLYVDVNRDACLTQGVSMNELFGTLQTYLGSRYVNDFNRFGRTWRVIVQAEGEFRDQVEDVKRLRVRNSRGQMVPLGTLASVRPIAGPLMLTRYNMYPAASVTGNVAPGYSTGQGLAALERLADRQLPGSMAYEWTELAFLERQSETTGMVVFGLSVVFVFLVLAALYESWSLPLAVILVVPLCVLSSIAGVALGMVGARRGLWDGITDINIFTQVGFVVLIGLACKNAILIVEFAKLRRDEGEEAVPAILAACRLRLRPILMTSLAFILGVVPLVIATGAGWEMRRALGTAVFSGMLGVTAFGIFLTPVFFLVIDRLSHTRAFTTGWAPQIGRAGLAALQLRPLRQLARQMWLNMSAATARKATMPPAHRSSPSQPATADEHVPVGGGDRALKSPDGP